MAVNLSSYESFTFEIEKISSANNIFREMIIIAVLRAVFEKSGSEHFVKFTGMDLDQSRF